MGHPEFTRLSRSAAPAALLCLALGTAGAAVPDVPAPSGLLARAESVKTADHPQFLRILKQLHEEQARLTPAQRWHLRYLGAWQAAFAGDLAKANPILHDIIAHSGDRILSIRASALLINTLSRGKHYEKAYVLANRLVSQLPGIADTRARAEAFQEIIQMLSFAGQYDQALQYARQLQSKPAPNKSQCMADTYTINVLFVADRLSSTSPELLKAIDLCLKDDEVVYANTLRLDKAYLLKEEGHARRAIALLHNIAPSIGKIGFQPHVASLYSTLAQAYLSRGDDARAKKAALAAVKASEHSGYSDPSQVAYNVLYKVERKAARPRAALSYYEKYVALDEAAMNDTRERTLAYQMVKQEVMAKRLKLETLTKQNRILQLHQALERKAAETSRLYIALLVILVIFVALWLYLTKHSQMRFRRMARHDGLTGAFNRQHFFDEAERTLRRLGKVGADACLVLLDLDHFKRINDTYGHATGDEVLRRAAVMCRSELRASDVFGRLGGEEFGILMPACSREQGVEIGDRIRDALANAPMDMENGATVTVSASFGLACTDASGYELTQLFTDADAALYSAKRSGRNQLFVGVGEDSEQPYPNNGLRPGPGPQHE